MTKGHLYLQPIKNERSPFNLTSGAVSTSASSAVKCTDPVQGLPAGGEDLFEVTRCIEQRPQTETQHGGVLAVQEKRPVDDVEEENEVVRRGEGARHRPKHRADQLP